MPTLGCPDDYDAFIVDSRTQVTFLRINWSSISWQRVRNEVSVASVTVAQGDNGKDCCAVLNVSGGLMGWENMLRIERNGSTVWDGPITGWTVQPSGDVILKAHDRAAIMMKRLIGAHRFLENSTPNTIIRQLLSDGDIGNPSFDPYPLAISSTLTTAELMTREYFVERLERVYDAIKEVTDNSSSGYYSTAVGIVYTNEFVTQSFLGTHSSGKCPILSEQNTIGRPAVDVDCLGMATITYAGAAGEGISGFPLTAVNITAQNLFLNSVLEQATPSSRSGETTDLSLVAGRAAAEHAAPAVTVEQFHLAPTFGSDSFAIDLSNLLPGSQFRVDFETSCAFNVPIAEYREAAGVPGIAYLAAVVGVRLDQLDVSVSRAQGGGIDEKVLASCRPIITGAVA